MGIEVTKMTPLDLMNYNWKKHIDELKDSPPVKSAIEGRETFALQLDRFYDIGSKPTSFGMSVKSRLGFLQAELYQENTLKLGKSPEELIEAVSPFRDYGLNSSGLEYGMVRSEIDYLNLKSVVRSIPNERFDNWSCGGLIFGCLGGLYVISNGACAEAGIVELILGGSLGVALGLKAKEDAYRSYFPALIELKNLELAANKADSFIEWHYLPYSAKKF